MGSRNRTGTQYARGRTVQVLTGPVAIDPPNVGAASKVSFTFSVVGASVGDDVAVQPPAALETGLIVIGARVSAADTVQVDLYNPTAGAIDGTSRTWTYIVQPIL